MVITNDSDMELPPIYNFQNQKSVCLFIIMSLVGVMAAALGKLINVPYQIPAILSGIIIGSVYGNSTQYELGAIDPSLLLLIYIPIALAKLTYANDNYLVLKSLPQGLIIVLLGNFFYIPVFAIMIKISESNISSNLGVFVAALIQTPGDCPSIPDLDGIKNLETLMRLESIFNIILCRIMFVIAMGYDDKFIVTWYHIFCVFLRYVGFAIPIGYIFGWVASLSIRQHFNDTQNAVCTVFAVSFFAYYFCENICYCSGCLAAFIVLFKITQQRSRLLTKTDNDIGLIINIIYTFYETLMIVIFISYITNYYSQDILVYDFLKATAIYIIGNVVRLVMFLLLSPILSHIGYGFDFTSLVTIFWAVHKGPYQLIHVILLKQSTFDVFEESECLLIYILLYVLLSHSVNGTTLNLFLKRFGLIKLSKRRKANISNGLNKLFETRNRVLTMLKLNRFYSDANWPIIYERTELQNKFSDFGFSRDLANEIVICDYCSTLISIEPSKQEYNEILKQVNMRVLKAQRVSFLKQHELGLLSKLETRKLLQTIEVAMDAHDMDMNIENLFRCINDNRPVMYMNALKRILIITSSVNIPKSGFHKLCYFISTSIYFELVVHVATIIEIVINVLKIANSFDVQQVYIDPVEVYLDSLCCTIFFLEFLLKLLSFVHVSCAGAWKLYFKNHWNKIDFFILIVILTEFFFAFIRDTDLVDSDKDYLKYPTLIIAVKLLKIFNRAYPTIVSYVERKKDFKLMRAFGLALAILVSCEEVTFALPTLTDNSSVRQTIKLRLLDKQSAIANIVGVLEKERPSLTTTVKTTQALRIILKSLREGIAYLLSAGVIDHFEYQRINVTFSEKQKYLENIKVLEVIQPQLIFYEIPWLGSVSDNAIRNFLYENVKTKIFNAGDVLCNRGDIPDGIYIIVAGFFKVTYFPTGDEMQSLKLNGELPVKEFLEYMRFDEVHEYFCTPGNKMGELACLTNRPYCCSIIAQAPSQSFIIPRDILQSAMARSPDPVVGLSAKLWKTVLLGLGRRILLTTPAYQSVTKEQLQYALNRAIVPEVSYYAVMSLSQTVEDVLLLEGIVVDYNTREIFTAPCPIPRHVTKLIMPLSKLISVRNIVTKLMLIPISHIDDYEMMQIIESNSELLPDYVGPKLALKPRRNTKALHSHVFGIRRQTIGSLYNKTISYTGSHHKSITGSKSGDASKH